MENRLNLDLRESILDDRTMDLKEFYTGQYGYDFAEEHAGEIRDFASSMNPYSQARVTLEELGIRI